jgi:PIN domain nuclease of toxin-antitoxin system
MAVKILVDTNLFVRFYHRQPLPAGMESLLESDTADRFISAVTVIEIYRLWVGRRLLIDPDSWLDEALQSWTVIPIHTAIARQSVLWDWSHRDPADRLIAATARIENIELWHTDTILKKLSGFPGRYFANKIRAS